MAETIGALAWKILADAHKARKERKKTADWREPAGRVREETPKEGNGRREAGE